MKHTVLIKCGKDIVFVTFALLLLSSVSLASANEPSEPTDCDLLAAHPRDSSKVTAGVEWEDLEFKKAVSACNRALKEYPGSARLMYQYGRALVKGGFYGNALKWHRKAADEGHVYAMYRLGVIYDNGEIVEKDVAQALKWHRKAADNGDVEAMFILGEIYAFDETGKKDVAQALKWYRKAADKGDAESKTIVARLETAAKEESVAKNEAIAQAKAAGKAKIVGNWKCWGINTKSALYYYDRSFSSSGRYVGYEGEQYPYEVDGDELIVFTKHGKSIHKITELTNNTLLTQQTVRGYVMGADCTKA